MPSELHGQVTGEPRVTGRTGTTQTGHLLSRQGDPESMAELQQKFEKQPWHIFLGSMWGRG
jgi:hypothetical protein